MVSIQDIANAAYRIKESSQGVQARSQAMADVLRQHESKLAQVSQGSRTGQDAVRQVGEAQRAVRECAKSLLALQQTVDQFIADVTK